MYVWEMDVDLMVLLWFLWKYILCLYYEEKSVLYFIFLKCLNVKKLKLNEFILRGEIYFFIFIFGCYYFLNCIIYLKFW